MTGQLAVGLAMLLVNQPYRGLPNRVTPIPLVTYRGQHWILEGPRVSYLFGSWKKTKASLTARYRFAGYDPDKSDYLRGMSRRKDTIDAGVSLKQELPWSMGLTAAFSADLLNQHKGFELLFALDRKIQIKKLTLTPSLDIRNESHNLADYYFGVRTNEAASYRPAYKLDNITNWGIGLSARYPFTQRQTILISAGREYLDTEIRQSPIIDQKFLTRFLAAWTYAF